ncbi:hypothetical protein D3C73_958500 [compost metagenome]
MHRDLAGDGGGQGAGAEVADLHVTRGNGGDDVGTVIEFAPVDIRLGRLLVGAVGLGDLGRIDGGLVGDGQVGRLGKQTRCGQRSGRQEAKGEVQFHGEAPCQAAEDRREKETK